MFLCKPSIAKSLINSGVGKSGSPTVKSITSKPCSRRLAAACMALKVEEVFILETFSETGKFIKFILTQSHKDAKRQRLLIKFFAPSRLCVNCLISREIRRGCRTGRGIRNDCNAESARLREFRYCFPAIFCARLPNLRLHKRYAL